VYRDEFIAIIPKKSSYNAVKRKARPQYYNLDTGMNLPSLMIYSHVLYQ
jgi:hypothetical protein